MNDLLLRRRGMMRTRNEADTDGYVTNGLVLYLKGYDASANRWIDRVNGHIIDLHNCTKTFDETGVIFNGSNSYGEAITWPNVDISSFNIEIVMSALTGQINTTLTGVIFPTAGPNSYSPTLVFYYNSYEQNRVAYFEAAYPNTPARSKPQKYLPSAPSVASASYGKVYKNAIACGTPSWALDYFIADSTLTNMMIGARRRNGVVTNYLGGTIYAIRIYNRPLTAEEVAANYAVDKTLYTFLA